MNAFRKRTQSFSVYTESDTSGNVTDDLVQELSALTVQETTNWNSSLPFKKRRACSAPRPLQKKSSNELSSSIVGVVVKGIKEALSNVLHHGEKEKKRVHEMSHLFVVPPSFPLFGADDSRNREDATAQLSYMYSYQIRPISFTSVCPDSKRLILVNFIFNCWVFKSLPTEPFFIAVSLLDQYLESITQMPDTRHMEAIVLATLQIALKYDAQMYLPDQLMESFDYRKINDCEMSLLRMCNFELGRHTFFHFVRILQPLYTPPDGSIDNWSVAKMISFIIASSSTICEEKPSIVAAAIARIMCQLEGIVWTPCHQMICQCSSSEMMNPLKQVIQSILSAKETPRKYAALVYFDNCGLEWITENALLPLITVGG